MKILQGLAGQTLEITLALSVVVAALLLLRPLLKKRYRAKLFYWAWLAVALRMVILWNPTLPKAPVQIPTTDAAIVYTRTEPAAGQGVPAAGQWSISTGQAVSAPTVPEGTGAAQPGEPDVSQPIPEQTQKTAALSLSLTELLTLLWLAGGLIFLGWNLLAYARFRRRVRRWKGPEEDPAVLSQFEVLREAAGVKRLTLARCAAISSPLVTGFLHPQLLLPQGVYSSESLDAIFRHELVHAKRGDLWYKLLLLAARGVHWFNPMVHLMARQAGRDLELSCDEAVVSGRDEDFRKSYSRAILSAVEGGVRRDAPLTSYFHGGKAALLERLKAIVSGNGKRRGMALICALVLLVGVVAAACSVAAAVPGDVPDDTLDSQPSGSDLFGHYDPFPVDPYEPEPTVPVPVEPDIAPEELLGMLPRTYWFHSGAGGWRTELNLGEDGTFSGEYSDSDMMTEYYCRFWGTFAQPERIAPFVWSLKIESLNTDGTPSEEEYIEGVRYVPSEPYGLENTEELLLYLPGARIADLPQDLLRAARWWDYCLPEGEGSLSNYEYLPFYGLYNPAEDAGFIALSEDGGHALVALTADGVPPVDRTTIHINELKQKPDYIIFSTVGDWFKKDVFIPMTKEEVFDYCGWSFEVAEVLGGFTMRPNCQIGVMQTPEGSTYLQSTFGYLSEDGTASATVALTPERDLGLIGYDISHYQIESSVINGIEMDILRFPEENNSTRYFAKFLRGETGFAVYGDDLAEEDYLRLLLYLTAPERQNSTASQTAAEPGENSALEGTIFRYGDRSYDLSERDQMINAITSCTPVGKYIIVEGHTGPEHSVYCIFNTETQEFEKNIVGANLTFYNDDINTIVYSFWSDICTYDGTVIGSCELGESDYISGLSFTGGNTRVTATVVTASGFTDKKIFALP